MFTYTCRYFTDRCRYESTPFSVVLPMPRIFVEMIRIREIADPELKAKIIAALAERRGMSVAAIPEWFELDDADYVDLLNDIHYPESGDVGDDPRM